MIRESRIDLLKRFQNSEIEVVFLRRDEVVFKSKDSTQKKFWEKLFETETFTLKDIKANFKGPPKIELTFQINKKTEVDYIEIQFKEKNRTWFGSTSGGPMLIKFEPVDRITLNVELRDVWDGR